MGADPGLLAILRRQAYLAPAGEAVLEILGRQAESRQAAPGEVLFVEGEPVAGLWVVGGGNVKVYKLAPDGREHVLHLMGPGATMNEIPAFDGGPNAASAAAITAVTGWVVPAAALAAAMAANHALALAVVTTLTGRVRHLVTQIEDLALRSVPARLARFLIEQRERPELATPAVTRAVLASYLATTPETVSRALRTLEATGAIRFDRHRIVILKPDLLRELAML